MVSRVVLQGLIPCSEWMTWLRDRPNDTVSRRQPERLQPPERTVPSGTSRPPLRVVPADERTSGINTPPPGRWLDLGRRGRTWVRESPGPEGAPTLILLHGLGATGGLNWAGSHLFLSDQFRIVTIDHRGHGRGV